MSVAADGRVSIDRGSNDAGTDCGGVSCTGPIPTVSEWGLILLAILITTAGTIVFRSRRPVASA